MYNNDYGDVLDIFWIKKNSKDVKTKKVLNKFFTCRYVLIFFLVYMMTIDHSVELWHLSSAVFLLKKMAHFVDNGSQLFGIVKGYVRDYLHFNVKSQ